jgi:hypothetical protein
MRKADERECAIQVTLRLCPAWVRNCFDRIVQQMQKQKNLPAQDAEEMRLFEAEAKALLKGG